MAKKKHSRGFVQCGKMQTWDASTEDTYGEVAERTAEEVCFGFVSSACWFCYFRQGPYYQWPCESMDTW